MQFVPLEEPVNHLPVPSLAVPAPLTGPVLLDYPFVAIGCGMGFGHCLRILHIGRGGGFRLTGAGACRGIVGEAQGDTGPATRFLESRVHTVQSGHRSRAA